LHAPLFSGISVPDVRNANRLAAARSHLLRWMLVCAAAVPFPSGCLSAPAPSVRQMDVIPAPARVAFRTGHFAVRANTFISIPRDADTARIARYFAGLLEEG